MPNKYYGRHTLSEDVRGAITFLVDFVAAKENRIAVWRLVLVAFFPVMYVVCVHAHAFFPMRSSCLLDNAHGVCCIHRSVLPQHFSTFDGHYEKGKEVNCSSNPLKLISSTRGPVIQNYNKAHEEAFSSFCDDGGNLLQNETSSSACGRREQYCTVNRTSVDYPTAYKFLSDNNFTRHMEQFRGGYDGKGSNMVTGKILRWNVADLFNVGQWHISDCSHYCYVPPLYEAAFERLLLLLDHHSETL